MKGDFSRLTFDGENPYSRVLMQQGRVLLDSDWNEAFETQLHSLRKLAVDAGGEHWGSYLQSDAFKISDVRDNNFTIGAGEYYVQGLCCSAKITPPATTLKYKSQPHWQVSATETFPVVAGKPNTLVYLDVWERHLTAVEQEDLREVALNGPDTTTRTKIIWQVKLLATASSNNSFKTGYAAFLGEIGANKPKGKLAAQLNPNTAANLLPCPVAPDSRYRGAENQLYRVEIHEVTIKPDGTPAKISFKWSRENGSVVFRIKEIIGNTVTLEHLGRDDRFGLKPNDWIEITNDDSALKNEPGSFHRVKEIAPEENQIKLDSIPSLPFVEATAEQKHFVLRRWDSALVEVTIPTSTTTWLPLEDGIEIQFTLGSNDSLRSGDYWLIPARVATGEILWPKDGTTAKALQPFGVKHHYAPLALIKAASATTDLRRILKQPWEA